jgi:hypothetical protein
MYSQVYLKLEGIQHKIHSKKQPIVILGTQGMATSRCEEPKVMILQPVSRNCSISKYRQDIDRDGFF